MGSFLFASVYFIAIYFLARLEQKLKNRWIVTVSLILAILPLIFVKYSIFVINNINALMRLHIPIPSIIVPMGISFFTFEAVSLLVDVFKGKVKDISLLHTYLYLSFVPTVTSGPIIRYSEFISGLEEPLFEADSYLNAVERIILGLGKKVLIANKIAILANYYFDGVAIDNNYSTIGLWIGSIAYTIQLYFDFSGYSDMAIGIGKLMGFTLRENFDKPYQASSISDFWKRWHISLTQWLRDYIYIPLGGNRCRISRHIFNMFVIWILTGIWHGADWSFVIWGLGYFVLLTIEKYVPIFNKISSSIIGHIYTLFFVNLLWIPFRAKNLSVTCRFLKGMFFGGTGIVEDKAIRFLPFLVMAISLCLPWNRWLTRFDKNHYFKMIKMMLLIIIFILALCAVVNSSYAPYIYGNF
ncbi:MAG: MBOAT family O-acyltransferase [Synergistaceae bacterium]|nr:MBOAT family O-acyltransferase [Synergistaceae bacterium]